MKIKDDILHLIKELISSFNAFQEVYLFGSILKPNVKSNDIDILVIYKEYSQKLGEDLKVFSQKIEEASEIAVDLTALSVEEEKEVGFLQRIKPKLLKLK